MDPVKKGCKVLMSWATTRMSLQRYLSCFQLTSLVLHPLQRKL